MSIWKKYLIPQTLDEAVSALNDERGEVRLIAGGTDLLLDLQQDRQKAVDLLVDVNKIPEMCQLEVRQEFLYIGAAVPLNIIANSDLVFAHARALTEASGLIGGPQVRNAATLGGNVAHALPAGDGTISLLALDAVAEIANRDGFQRIPMQSLFLGPGKSALNAHRDILVGFYIPLIASGQASAFSRVMRPQGVALPILNMAIWLDRSEEIIKNIRISLGPAGPTPQRGIAAENVFRGRQMTEALQNEALEALLQTIHFRTSPQRATAEYRRHLAGVLLGKVLHSAWNRAKEAL